VRRQHARRADVGHGGHLALHLLRDGHHHRAGAAAARHVEGVRHQLGDARGVVDLRHPLGERREHLAVVHLLEGLAVGFLEGDLADESTSGVESWKATWTPMAAWQAPGPRVTMATPGLPVSLP
jgi:hypothetical protein